MIDIVWFIYRVWQTSNNTIAIVWKCLVPTFFCWFFWEGDCIQKQLIKCTPHPTHHKPTNDERNSDYIYIQLLYKLFSYIHLNDENKRQLALRVHSFGSKLQSLFPQYTIMFAFTTKMFFSFRTFHFDSVFGMVNEIILWQRFDV